MDQGLWRRLGRLLDRPWGLHALFAVCRSDKRIFDQAPYANSSLSGADFGECSTATEAEGACVGSDLADKPPCNSGRGHRHVEKLAGSCSPREWLAWAKLQQAAHILDVSVPFFFDG